jgi:hypothetical protein
MLNANPGLRDICHSITGGALAAQGSFCFLPPSVRSKKLDLMILKNKNRILDAL